jgi:hypothetical protein
MAIASRWPGQRKQKANMIIVFLMLGAAKVLVTTIFGDLMPFQ